MATRRAGTQNDNDARLGLRGRRSLLVTAVVPLLLLTGAGTAAAYWGRSGVGTGDAAVEVHLSVVISPGTPAAQLYPGGDADVSQTISNPNPYPVHIDSLSLDTDAGSGGYAVDAGHSGCVLSTLTFATQTNGGSGWTIPAKVGAIDGSLDVTLVDALVMGIGAANACQGATFTVYLQVGP